VKSLSPLDTDIKGYFTIEAVLKEDVCTNLS